MQAASPRFMFQNPSDDKIYNRIFRPATWPSTRLPGVRKRNTGAMVAQKFHSLLVREGVNGFRKVSGQYHLSSVVP